MVAILDFRSCDIWEHLYVYKWIDHTPKHEIRHQDHLGRLNDTKVMLVFNFGYFGWRTYWIWLKKGPSRFFPPGILIDLVNRPPNGNDYEGFKTIPIFSRSNPIFMRLIWYAAPKDDASCFLEKVKGKCHVEVIFGCRDNAPLCGIGATVMGVWVVIYFEIQKSCTIKLQKLQRMDMDMHNSWFGFQISTIASAG